MTAAATSDAYRFSNNWFNDATKGIWRDLLEQLSPSRVLEIGSFEGASACFVIDEVAVRRPLELHCIDTWVGGREHQAGSHAASDMAQVETSFRSNLDLALSRAKHPVSVQVHKGRSDEVLPKLLTRPGPGHFDLLYIDGSHQAADVLFDAVVGFRLLRVGGVIVFDDYLWTGDSRRDLLSTPKIAIDAFTNIHANSVAVLAGPLYQLYVLKLAN